MYRFHGKLYGVSESPNPLILGPQKFPLRCTHELRKEKNLCASVAHLMKNNSFCAKNCSSSIQISKGYRVTLVPSRTDTTCHAHEKKDNYRDLLNDHGYSIPFVILNSSR